MAHTPQDILNTPTMQCENTVNEEDEPSDQFESPGGEDGNFSDSETPEPSLGNKSIDRLGLYP